MSTLNRYIARDFLVTFIFTITIFTFVMTVGGLVKAIDVMSRGVSGLLVLKFFVNNIPFMLMFSLPMSVLAAVLLVFGRLSADGELTAMKASGLSMWQVVSSVILLSIILSVVCFAISANIAPRASYARRTMERQLGVETPLSLLEEGTWVRDFPGLVIYIGRKKDMRLDDVAVFQTKEGSERTSVRAKYGIIRDDVGEDMLQIDLHDVRIYQPDPKSPRDPSKGRYVSAAYYPVPVDVSKLLRREKPKKKRKDMTFRELLDGLADLRSLEPELDPQGYRKLRASLVVEANKRVTLALSCFAFTLLAIPLGLKSRRRESSVGIALSLLLAFIFYFFTILAESMANRPELRPELVIWLPVILMEVVGAYLIWRNR